MSRIRLALIVIGGMVAFFGLQEFRVSRGTSTEPVSIELAELESGKPLPNNHLQIGPHVALYPATVYMYRQGKYSSAEPTTSTSVNYCFYPIISKEHPVFTAVEQGQEPGVTNLAVLVKTKRFPTIGSITSETHEEAGVQGLVINEIDALDNDEKKLIQESFPQVDVDKLWILEQDRKPATLAKSLGMLFGGVVLALGGIGWILFERKRTRLPA